MTGQTAAAMPRLLIVEDDLGLCGQYRWAFPEFEVLFAHDRAQALMLAQSARPAVAIMDLGLPPDPDGVSEGFATLDGLTRQAPEIKIIVATSHGDRSHALRAIAAGAYDFCEKPIEISVLTTIVSRSLKLHKLETENREASGSTNPPHGDIITADPAMLKICRDVEKLAGMSATALLSGEAGSGKAYLAQAIHTLGPRASQPYITVHCGNTPEALLESELFGHERWAFSGVLSQTPGQIEAAGAGTLFLNEIGEMSLAVQARLLRLLRDGKFERVGGREALPSSVRILAATGLDLESRLARGAFNGELYYRLTAVTLRVPPLRDRRGDPALLARHFLTEFARAYGRTVRGVSEDALAALAAHAWPGNVRELESRMRRAVVMAAGRLVTASDLELAPGIEDMTAYDLRAARARAEREVVQRALARSNGTLATAARLLGVSRPTLYSLLEAHGLTSDGAGASEPAIGSERTPRPGEPAGITIAVNGPSRAHTSRGIG